ncbi:MAG: 23S rRNA (guanosine(2251)-2'-O)-methyltransferase RlmB [Coxiellaceae bacterium]|nr:23S rRNA (guanosine(2251)-2'-O)-methyltransferase RlmB [Coxiellaceae bacterium]
MTKKNNKNKKSNAVFGFHAVHSLLQAKPDSVEWVAVQKGRDDQRAQQILELAHQQGITLEHLNKKAMEEAADGNHQGFIAQCHHFPSYTQADLMALIEAVPSGAAVSPLVLILDGIQDPHNLGAIMRSSDALGVMAIVIAKDNAVGMTSTVQKVASGAALTVPLVTVTNLSRCMQALRQAGLWLVGLDASAEDRIESIDMKGPVGVVMGNEGHGMRRGTRDKCDFLAHIPMTGTVSSMNVSVAAGIVLYEVNRQR